MNKIPLHFKIFIGLIGGMLFGYFAPSMAVYVKWAGDLFMQALKMIIVPLVFSSIVTGVANVGSAENLGRIGAKTITYYISTSLIAILTGLFFVNWLKPGLGIDLKLAHTVSELSQAKGSFVDVVYEMVPKNIFQAMSEGNMLGIIFFALLFGFFITRVDEKFRVSAGTFFEALYEIMMKMTHFIISFTPYGVFAIMANTISDNYDKLSLVFQSLGVYGLTVLLGLFVHFFLTLPLITWVFGRKANPYAHMRNLRPALFTAFSTASSGATLSLTMDCVTRKSGVSPKIASFTLPLGATINMDGTALYELVAALFIAQAYGIDLSLIQQIVLVFTALLASIGAAAIPMAGLVMLTMVLSSVGLPLEGIGIIIAIDRLLDMFRTTVNVWSDACGAVVVAKSEGEVLNI